MEGCEPGPQTMTDGSGLITTSDDGSGVSQEDGDSDTDPLALLVGLNGEELNDKDRRIVLTLMELEELRGRQQDMKHEIQVRLNLLEALLEGEDPILIGNGTLSTTEKSRKGKTFGAFAEEGLGPNFVETAGKIAGAIPGFVVSK